MKPLGRFFIINVLALGIDATASAIALFLISNLYLATCIGVGMSFVVAYVAHEYWSFEREESGLSSKRFAMFALNCSFILLARLAVIGAIKSQLASENFWMNGVIWFIAAGVSFLLNFFISRKFIFKGK